MADRAAEKAADRDRAEDELRQAVIEFLAAEDAVDIEARESQAQGRAWSSAPVVRRLHALKRLRAAVENGFLPPDLCRRARIVKIGGRWVRVRETKDEASSS